MNYTQILLLDVTKDMFELRFTHYQLQTYPILSLRYIKYIVGGKKRLAKMLLGLHFDLLEENSGYTHIITFLKSEYIVPDTCFHLRRMAFIKVKCPLLLYVKHTTQNCVNDMGNTQRNNQTLTQS